MTELRARMVREMTLRGFSPRTHKSYIAAVVTDDALGQSFYPGDGRGFRGGLQWRW